MNFVVVVVVVVVIVATVYSAYLPVVQYTAAAGIIII
jgi:hypothetical protein